MAEHSFPLVVDHAYIWVSRGAPELRALQELGLKPHGHVTFHESQGTASQSILFKNMYLELVWVEDAQELADFEATLITPSGPPENWIETGLSPFGIGLHYRTPDTAPLPIETEIIKSPWMPEDSFIQSVPHLSPYGPLLFILHGSLAYWDVREELATHPLGVQNLTEIGMTLTTLDNLDPLIYQLAEHSVVRLSHGPQPLLELTFDHHGQGKSFDGRPALPLIIHY